MGTKISCTYLCLLLNYSDGYSIVVTFIILKNPFLSVGESLSDSYENILKIATLQLSQFSRQPRINKQPVL